MSKSGMHINISGGNAVIGNISQGHGSRLRAEQITSLVGGGLLISFIKLYRILWPIKPFPKKTILHSKHRWKNYSKIRPNREYADH